MIFGPVPVAQAEGAVLAHSVRARGVRLKKGLRLGQDEITALIQAGLSEVTVARLEPGDVDEDAAADRLARALVPYPDGVGLRLGRAATGRVNIYAQGPGLVQVNAAKIHAVNGVHPAITVATVPEWQRVGPRHMVATVKIIAYAVPDAALRMACDVGDDALTLRPATLKHAVLIQTSVDGDQATLHDKGHQVTAERLDRLAVDLGPQMVVPHRIDALSSALRQVRDKSDVILILTGSATSDLYDIAPQALRQAGGVVHHYGMPVDPGNLLFYGDLQGMPVIGLPGCARAPALNGADWVMERILCGIPVTPADITRMGVGGLLKEVPQRGRPREGA